VCTSALEPWPPLSDYSRALLVALQTGAQQYGDDSLAQPAALGMVVTIVQNEGFDALVFPRVELVTYRLPDGRWTKIPMRRFVVGRRRPAVLEGKLIGYEFSVSAVEGVLDAWLQLCHDPVGMPI
jgi:hypothetical protein